MKKTVKILSALLLCILYLAGAALLCHAAPESGTVTVTLENRAETDGTDVRLCKIAELDSTGYYPAEGFRDTGISLSAIVNAPTEAAAKDVADHIRTNGLEFRSAVTENGTVTFSGLELGIWLVFCPEDGAYTFNPFFVFLPYEEEGALCYEVASFPKVEGNDPHRVSLYVIKKWDDGNNAAGKRPASVTVRLEEDGQVLSSAVLSEQNGWAHTFTDLPKDGRYTVTEEPVEHYTAAYSGDAANGFIVTNSYNGEKLPQTGQLWWPIVILAIAGLAFVALGILELGARKNEKKGK